MGGQEMKENGWAGKGGCGEQRRNLITQESIVSEGIKPDCSKVVPNSATYVATTGSSRHRHLAVFIEV
jgi:hypothetical protein